jgi:glycosyltransferase involved in cell wall biosynthesis
MTSRLRSLVVFPEPPLREGRAAARCEIALLRGLRRHGVEVRAIAARQHFALAGAPPEDLDVEVVDVPPEPPGWRTRLQHLQRPLGELARGSFAERVVEASHGVDVVHLEEVSTAACARGLAVPSVVHVHYLARLDRGLGPPWRRQFREVLEFDRAERAALRSQWLVASSPVVCAELRRRSRAHVELVPLSLDPADYPIAALDGPPTAGIIGTGSWPTTGAAMRRLVFEVWPRVRRLVPEARLLVAGRGTGTLGLDAPGVEILGEVPSAVEFMHRLSVLLFPIERGSGMKVKTLEAIAVGLPVVTTPAGGEGIEAGPGLVVQTTDDALATAAASILDDPGERRQRGAAARAAFEARYSPLPATEPLVELYRRIADAR